MKSLADDLEDSTTLILPLISLFSEKSVQVWLRKLYNSWSKTNHFSKEGHYTELDNVERQLVKICDSQKLKDEFDSLNGTHTKEDYWLSSKLEKFDFQIWRPSKLDQILAKLNENENVFSILS